GPKPPASAVVKAPPSAARTVTPRWNDADHIQHVDPTVHPHPLDVDGATAGLASVSSVLQDSGAGRRRAVPYRRVPQAQPVGSGATVRAGRPQARSAPLMPR